jgi:uncharacterized protein (DUF2164 family)
LDRPSVLDTGTISTMAIEFTKQESEEIIHSLKKYFSSELDQELSDLKAKFLLDYMLKEIAPLAYNLGVKHSEEYFRARLEDLSATVFEPGLIYWQKKRK